MLFGILFVNTVFILYKDKSEDEEEKEKEKETK
jgi:hypothetical protein